MKLRRWAVVTLVFLVGGATAAWFYWSNHGVPSVVIEQPRISGEVPQTLTVGLESGCLPSSPAVGIWDMPLDHPMSRVEASHQQGATLDFEKLLHRYTPEVTDTRQWTPEVLDKILANWLNDSSPERATRDEVARALGNTLGILLCAREGYRWWSFGISQRPVLVNEAKGTTAYPWSVTVPEAGDGAFFSRLYRAAKAATSQANANELAPELFPKEPPAEPRVATAPVNEPNQSPPIKGLPESREFFSPALVWGQAGLERLVAPEAAKLAVAILKTYSCNSPFITVYEKEGVADKLLVSSCHRILEPSHGSFAPVFDENPVFLVAGASGVREIANPQDFSTFMYGAGAFAGITDIDHNGHWEFWFSGDGCECEDGAECNCEAVNAGEEVDGTLRKFVRTAHSAGRGG